MGKLVDSERVGSARVVAHAKSEIGEYEASRLAVDLEHHAEPAGRGWKIDLRAPLQPRSVLGFAVAGDQILDGAAVSFVGATRLKCDRASSVGSALEVLVESRSVEDDPRVTRPLSGHDLPLAVGWPDRPVLLDRKSVVSRG